MQRALMQFFKPENYFEVREALIQAGRADLIGGCEGLIAGQPPKEAIKARRRQANAAANADHYHTVPNPRQNKGYRPGRVSQTPTPETRPRTEGERLVTTDFRPSSGTSS